MRTATRCALTVLLGVVLGGCFTADVTLNADGSGTMKVTYEPMWSTTDAVERRALQGPGVTVQELKLGELRDGPGGMKMPKSVDARMSFASVAELVRVERLARFQVALADAGENTKQLTVSVKTQKAQTGQDPTVLQQPATVRVHLPGDVVESSAKVEGRTVVWTFTTAEYLGKPGLKMTATYKIPAGAGTQGAPAAGGTGPAGAATPGGAPAKSAPAGNPS